MQKNESTRPLILVTNDDGVAARGIRCLAEIASRFGDVIVAAPASAQSGKSSALTVGDPLYVKPQPDWGDRIKVFAISGTPVDCVKLALHAITPDRRPDLLLSGINHGSNAAVNNIYSGTMGAVMEGCLVGIPSVGFSLLSHSPEASFYHCDKQIETVVDTVLTRGLPADVCLNVNFPAVDRLEGLKVVRAARGYWSEEFAEYTSPWGTPFYWLTGKFHNLEPDNPDTDEYWLARGWGSVVPIRPDQTAHDAIEVTKEALCL